MKKLFLVFFFSFFLIKFSAAQILCVQCFEQNDSVWAGSNNLILNGGFENTNCAFNSYAHTFCPNGIHYDCNIANWTCTGGGIDTYALFKDSNTCYVEKGIRSAYFGNYYCGACQGGLYDTSCLNLSGCIVTGVPANRPISNMWYGNSTIGVGLSQTVNGLIVGDTYVLEFWAGGEYDTTLFTKKGLFALDVGFGRTFLRCKPTAPHTGIGTRYVVVFNATSSSHTITFTNWGHVDINNTELILDDVKLFHWNGTIDPPLPCNISVGISEPTEKAISISPNPFSNQLIVKSNHPSTIIIYDLLSRKLLSQTFINTITLNTEFLSKGIYMYEVRTEKGSEKGKVIKE